VADWFVPSADPSDARVAGGGGVVGAGCWSIRITISDSWQLGYLQFASFSQLGYLQLAGPLKADHLCMLSDPLLLRTHCLLGFNGPLVLSSGALAVIVGPLAVVGCGTLTLSIGALAGSVGAPAIVVEIVVAGKRVAVDVEAGPRWRGDELLAWKSLKIVRSAALRSRTGAGSMMVATGARVRLIRRGAARPVGVRWAAPIACAGSVQAVAKRQRCLRHRWNQVSSKARKQAPEQHRRGAPAHGARHHLGNHTPRTRPPTHAYTIDR